MGNYELIYFMVDGNEIPIKRYYERRKNVRISIGKDSVLLRIPSFMNKDQRHSYHVWAKEWLIMQLKKSQSSLDHLIPINYLSGDRISCMEMHYTLHIEEKKRSSSGAKIKEDRILLSLDEKLFGVNKSEIIKTALSRVFAKKYKHEVEKRLELINKHYFGHAVKSLRLKYNKSNWGSCSNSGNINLSTRLLMAPQWVLDYVIVHELAHMNEMNHSKKYWAIVEKVYPEYKKAEKWLKAYGSTCDFVPVRTIKQLDNHKKRKA
tara:strand:+ start:1400 stop:2188 length:789 start_codon:yes stop_codon:yes gene_type:complete